MKIKYFAKQFSCLTYNKYSENGDHFSIAHWAWNLMIYFYWVLEMYLSTMFSKCLLCLLKVWIKVHVGRWPLLKNIDHAFSE